MTDAPLYVSVLMPAYQVEKYLAEAIDSILAQTHPYFELIILNDASVDGTLQIAQKYASQDSRVRVLSHAENMGFSRTCNDLLNSAKYDWVFILDGDDRMLPNRIERQLAFLQDHPDLVLAGALSFYIDPSGKRIGQFTTPLTSVGQVRHAIESDQPIWFPTVAFHRPTALSINGYYQEDAAADTQLYSHLAQVGPILCQPEVLGEYRKLTRSHSVINIDASKKAGRWISASMRARRLGQPIPDLKTYAAIENNLPFFSRLVINMKDLSAVLFKRVVVAYSSRKYGQAIFFAMLCGFVWPPQLWFRIRNRKVFLTS